MLSLIFTLPLSSLLLGYFCSLSGCCTCYLINFELHLTDVILSFGLSYCYIVLFICVPLAEFTAHYEAEKVFGQWNLHIELHAALWLADNTVSAPCFPDFRVQCSILLYRPFHLWSFVALPALICLIAFADCRPHFALIVAWYAICLLLNIAECLICMLPAFFLEFCLLLSFAFFLLLLTATIARHLLPSHLFFLAAAYFTCFVCGYCLL